MRNARYVADATPARRLLCFVACFGLILSSLPAVPSGLGESAEKPVARLTQGPPGLNLPDLDAARRMSASAPRIAPPVSAPFASMIAPPAPAPPPTQENNWPLALIDQRNRVGTGGEDLLSRNYNWGLPIVSLPGRAGLDLDLGLSLNSLVWTRSGNNMYFNLDMGFPSPGFRLGLPELGATFYNPETGTPSALVTMPSGQRREFRLNAAYDPEVVYEEMGSTYMLLVFKVNPLDDLDETWNLLLTDGTAYKFRRVVNNFKCVEVKDRNGNYISITYTPFEQINTVTDTMERVVNFNYDSSNRLTSVTQNWGSGTHTYATFAYDAVTIQTNFPGLDLLGTANGAVIPVLSRVTMADGKIYAFEYNSYAQVKVISCYGPNSESPGSFPGDYTLLSQVTYDLTPGAGAPQSDCPRFFSRIDWAEGWNSGVLTSYDGDGATWGSAETLDGTVYKEFFGATGWRRGLTLRTEIWSNDSRKKWTEATWANGDPNVTYWLNPRVVETNVQDDGGNHKKTTMAYADFGAISEVREYDAPANPTAVLRRTNFEYLRGAAYTGNLERRLTRLVKSQTVHDGGGAPRSKVTYEYDLADQQYLVHEGPPVRHDTANFGAGFVHGRGNLNVVRRWDVNAPNDGLASTIGYNTSGSVIFSRDPLGHGPSMSYTDSFSDAVNRNTFAYPTETKDADQNPPSKVQYNYDFGAVTRTENPKGAAVVTTYDPIGRLDRVTNEANSAYTRYVYAPNHLQVESYTTVNDLGSEFYRVTVFDGHGRPRGLASAHPGSAGGYKAQKFEYDVLGRLERQSNPTEVNGAWEPVGDDEAAGWAWSEQEYDWMGRPTVATDQRGNTSIVDYGGCGCAGGEAITTQDEGQVNDVGGVPTLQRRKTQIIHDALGREKKRVIYNWDGTVYASATTTYNVLNQATSIRQYKGDGDGVSCPTGTCQEATSSYDGHGRLAARRRAQEDGNTTYTYYANDLLQSSTDARGATGTFTYNNRRLMTGASYAGGSGVLATPSVSFDYDELGKPVWMEDGPGRVDYSYDNQGRLMSETRRFDSLSGMAFHLSYDYNLAGEIKQVTDPRGDAIHYGYDSGGRLTGVTGSSFAGVTDYATGFEYRAWGQPKRLDYGDSFHAEIGYDAQMRVNSFNIPGVLGASYTVNENGRVRSAQSLIDSRLNRSFAWDHMGRIVRSATTGNPVQFDQNYGYDEYGHTTSRSGWYWNTSNNSMTATYSRERAVSNIEQDTGPGAPTYNRSFQYDAMGNTRQVTTTVTVNGQSSSPTTESRLYDAVGRLIAAGTLLDGYGRVVKENQQYNLIATPFGGQVLTILDSSGQKTKGRVYVGTDLLAEQMMMSGQPSEVVWRRRDPMNTASRDTKSGGWTGQLHMVDPLGTMLDPTTASGISGINAEGNRQAGDGARRPGGGAQTMSSSSFYTPNYGTYSGSGAPGQYGGGCFSASCGSGSQMDFFNRMSPDMLAGYQRYAQTLYESGYFDSMGRLGQETLASSFAGVTAAGVGGTYTLKPDFENSEEQDEWGNDIWIFVGFKKEFVPGGAPQQQQSGGQQGGGQQGGGPERGPACGFLAPAVSNAAKTAAKAAPAAAAEGAGLTLLGTLFGVLGILVSTPKEMGKDDTYNFMTVYRHAKGLNPGEFKPEGGTVSTWEHKNPDRKYNVPFNGKYFGEQKPGTLAVITGVPEVPRLTAVYTPLPPNGPGHWDLIQPAGMSDEAFKKGLSDYARRIFQGCK